MRLRVCRWCWIMASSSSPDSRPSRTSRAPTRSSMGTWLESQPTISPWSKKIFTNSWARDSTSVPLLPWVLIMLKRENRSKSRNEPSSAIRHPLSGRRGSSFSQERRHSRASSASPSGSQREAGSGRISPG